MSPEAPAGDRQAWCSPTHHCPCCARRGCPRPPPPCEHHELPPTRKRNLQDQPLSVPQKVRIRAGASCLRTGVCGGEAKPVPVSQGLYPISWGMMDSGDVCGGHTGGLLTGWGQGTAQPHSAQDAPRKHPALMCAGPTGFPYPRDSGHQHAAPQPSNISLGGLVEMQILGLPAPALDQKVPCVSPKLRAIPPHQGSRTAGRGSRFGFTISAGLSRCPRFRTAWRRATHRASGLRGWPPSLPAFLWAPAGRAPAGRTPMQPLSKFPANSS